MPTRDELNRFNARAQALGEAASKGDVKTMNRMLAEEPALATHARPFSDACKAGQPEAVRRLIRAGVDVNTTDGSGPGCAQKPLLWTIRPTTWTAGHPLVLDVLLDAGADPNGGALESVVTPLLAAAEWNHPEAVARLIERGARVGFYEAIAIGDVGAVETFLERSPDLAGAVRHLGIGFQSGPGTSVHCAAISRLGNHDPAVATRLAAIAERLIARGAPVREITIDGVVIPGPIANAARSGNVAVANVLLRHGADPHDALVPALRESAMAILDLLADFPLDLDVPGDPKLGNLILQDLIRYGKVRGAEWLLMRGASTGGADRNGWTVLHYASSRGVSPEFGQLLLQHGAELNPRDATGATPLGIARQRRQTKLVDFLEARGAID